MNYYWYDRRGVLQKSKEKYHNGGGKERAAERFTQNKDVINQKANDRYKNLSK